MLYILIIVLYGAAIFLAVDSIFETMLMPRYVRLTADAQGLKKMQEERGFIRLKLLKPFEFLIKPLSRLRYIQNLEMQAEVLQINLDLSLLVAFKAGLMVAVGAATWILFSPVHGIAGLAVGFFIPDFIMLNKIKHKKEAIVKFFPETVDLMNMSIGAGADFLSAVRWTIEKSLPNPFIEQLVIVLNEIRVGKTRAEALKDMSKRLQLTDISSFVRTLVQAERMGTSIEEAFENLSEDTRSRRFQEGERYAIRASLKILFPLLFCILPVIMILVAGPILIKFLEGELIPKAGL